MFAQHRNYFNGACEAWKATTQAERVVQKHTFNKL